MINIFERISNLYTDKCIDLYFLLLKTSHISVLDFHIK